MSVDQTVYFDLEANMVQSILGDPDYFDFDLQSSVDRYKAMRNYYPQTSPKYNKT